MSKIGNHRIGLQETDAYKWGWDWAEMGMQLLPWMTRHLGQNADVAQLGWQDYHDQEVCHDA